MIPNDNARFKTDGERHFYKFLENVAKPDTQKEKGSNLWLTVLHNELSKRGQSLIID